MSRPFSYSDENFNVIGNVLFCHIYIRKSFSANENIVEIPPEIYDRLLFKSQRFNNAKNFDSFISSDSYEVGVRSRNGKHYLISNASIGVVGDYLVGFYILKDI